MKEILLGSGVLILVLAAARWLLRGKVSQRLLYSAWLLVALRLVLPVQLGELSFSATGLAQRLEENVPQVQQQAEQFRQAMDQSVVGQSQEEIYSILLQEAREEGQDVESAQVQQLLQLQARQQAAPTLEEVLRTVWLTGAVVMAAWFLWVNLRFSRRARRGAVKMEQSQSCVPVYISENIHGPCLSGLFRPVIYLTPECARDSGTCRHVVTHELTHLAHGDLLWSWVRCLLLCVYWFDPLVWLAAVLSKRDCELACDEGALQRLGQQERFQYGRTLVDMVARSSKVYHLLETATSMNESKKQLTERVNFIVKKHKNYLIAAICLVLVAALAAGCAFTGGSTGTESSQPEPTESSSDPAPTESTGATVNNPVESPVRYPAEVSGAVTIELWHTFTSGTGMADTDAMSRLVKEFNRENQWNITVKASYKGSYNDVLEATQEAMEQGTNPVLIVTSETGIGTLGLGSQLQDLTLYLERDGLDYNEIFYESLTQSLLVYDIDGNGTEEILGAPLNRSVSLAYHNLQVWAQIGVTKEQIPNTIEELIPLWEQIYETTGQYGLAMTVSADVYQCGLIQSLAVKNTGSTNGGITGLDGITSLAIGDGTMQTLLEDWASWCDAGWCWRPDTTTSLSGMLGSCQVATVFSYSGYLGGYARVFSGDQQGMGLAAEDLYVTMQPGYGGWASRASGGNLVIVPINHTEEEIDAAWKFLCYATMDPENVATFAAEQYYVCACKAAVETQTWKDAVAAQPLLAVAQEGMDCVYDGTPSLNRQAWLSRAKEVFNSVIVDTADTRTPEEWLAGLQKELEDLEKMGGN